MEKQRFSTDNLIALCNTDEQVRYSINQIGDHLNDLCDGEDYRITLMEEEPQDKKLFRWRNALPGHRAFSRLVKKDSRIDEEKPKLKLGELPEEPKSQNSLWYSLYKKCSDAITVSEAHKTFLLARDLATVSFVFAIMGPWGLLFFGHRATWALLYFVSMTGQYLLLSIVAQNHGKRFVCNVITECMANSSIEN